MGKNIIKKLELDLGKKTITLNMEQAQKLKEALDELFGKKIVREVHEHHDHYHENWYPHWYWHYPYWCSDTVSISEGNFTWGSANTAGLISASYNGNNQSMCLSLS